MSRNWKPFVQRIADAVSLRGRFKRKPPRRILPFLRWFPGALPKLRLSHQLIGFFVVVVLFPLLLLSVSIYSINQKAVKKQISRFTEHTALATYDELRLEMAWQQEQAKMASEYWRTLLLVPNAEAQTRQMTSFFKSYPDYEAVALYNPAGQQTALYARRGFNRLSSFPTTLPPQSSPIAFHLAHEVGAKGRLTYRLQVYVPGRFPGQEDGVGTLVFAKHFPYLERLFEERFETFEDGFVMVDADGVIIAGPQRLLSQRLSPSDLTIYQSLKEGMVKEFSSRGVSSSLRPPEEGEPDDVRLEKVLIKVPRLGWGLVMESPYHLKRSYILKARTQSVALVFLCILVIVVLGLLYSRGINRNFRQLIKGIKALAEGRYSRKIRLITKSWTPYEIVYLTAEVNRMASKISSAWASIQKLNQELVYKNQQDLFMADAIRRLHSSLELETVCETATQILIERSEIGLAQLYLLTSAEHYERAAHAHQALSPWASLMPDLTERHAGALLETLFAEHLTCPLPPETLAGLPQGTMATLHPIVYQQYPLGALLLVRHTDRIPKSAMFSEEMVINLLSSQIGVAIYQARQWNQLQRANCQLAKLDEMKSNLIDTVSHELRTPLTNIKGYTSRLIRYEGALDSATTIKSLKVIKQQADRLGRLVEDLLVIPDLEREGGIRVFPDQVNLTELLARSVSFIGEKANREIRVLAPDAPLDILADPDRMEQVLLNLLDNAIKYSPEGTEIEVVACQISDTMAQIQVFNPCDPIAPEDLATLFEKFKRLDERLTRTTRGTGLGLYITKSLVEAMGGRIWLEGHDGFRVFVAIPLYAAIAPHPSVESALVTRVPERG